MSWSGIDERFTYCPVCGNHIFYGAMAVAQGSRINYNDGKRPYHFYCYCGWNGPDNELFNEKNYKQEIRKNKLIKIKNYEN